MSSDISSDIFMTTKEQNFGDVPKAQKKSDIASQ